MRSLDPRIGPVIDRYAKRSANSAATTTKTVYGMLSLTRGRVFSSSIVGEESLSAGRGTAVSLVGVQPFFCSSEVLRAFSGVRI